MPLTANLTVALGVTLTNVLDLVTATAPLAVSRKTALADGTGAGKARKVFSDTRTLTTGANENLDLAGTLADAFGTTLTFTNLKAIYLASAAANTTTLIFTAPSSNGYPGVFAALGDGLLLQPGSYLLLVSPGSAGFGAVTGGTGDLLNVANAAGASATYSVVLIGE